jgi:predicted acyl esterase
MARGVIRTVRITLDPKAYRFKPRHRIPLQISGGDFPRFARNLGTGESPGTRTAMRTTNQTVHHDSAHPSHISMPVTSSPSSAGPFEAP